MKGLFALIALIAFAAPIAAQESLVNRVHKLETRLDSLEKKMDKVLDFISANYGPNTKTAKAANCDCAVTGVCTCGNNCQCINGRGMNCANGVCSVGAAGACASGSCGTAGTGGHGGLVHRLFGGRLFGRCR